MTIGKLVSGAVLGACATPVLEYAWHAWIAHGRGSKDPSRAAHLEHHRTAHTEGDAWAEIRENLPRVAGTTAVVGALLAPFLGLPRATGVALGLGTGYVAITLAHARMHVRAPRTPAEEWMWRFHFHHHYVDPRVNFGLTSPAFDYVFGTAVAPEEVALPAAALPSWWTGAHRGFRVQGEQARSA